MKPLFGEFLIEKKVIAEDVLVSVLIEQSEQMASLSGVLFQAGYLKANQILTVMRQQLITQGTFEQTCRNLGFWSSEVNAYYQTEWSKHRKMLGELLIEKGHIDANRLVELLEEYIHKIGSESAHLVTPILDNVQLEELKFQFRSELRVSLGLKVFELAFSPQPELLEQFRIWVGVARFIQMRHLEELAARCVSLLESDAGVDAVVDVLNQALEVMGKIQVNGVKDRSEEYLLKSASDREQWVALMAAMDRLMLSSNLRQKRKDQ